MNADLTDPAECKKIGDLPLELEEEVDSGTYLWYRNSKKWRKLNLSGTKSPTQIRHMLFSVERTMETGSSPQMARILDKNHKVQVEHILPENAAKQSEEFYDEKKKKATTLHSRYVYAFGNHCLIEGPMNSQARNNRPINKVVYYKDSTFKTTMRIKQTLLKGLGWSADEIGENSLMMMRKLIDFYNNE